jgi:hypothetical protein
MLTKCLNCGFYVRQDDDFCLDCGLKNPTKNPYKNSKIKFYFFRMIQTDVFKLILSFFAAVAIIYPMVDIAQFYFPKFSIFILIFAIFTWALLFFTLIFLVKSFEFRAPMPRITKNKDNLKSKDKIIENRVIELNKRQQRIDTILDKIKETDGQNLQEVRHKLLSAREIVINQFARYELQKQKIELVRLQNSVAPYLFALHRLNEFETENGLAAIETTKTEVNKIRQNLTNYVAIEFPAHTLNEKENFLSQLTETENSCEKLREALLSKQAACALQGISPIEENLKLPSAKEIIHSVETFNVETVLTDFSESFEELEREYRRVRAENEVGQKLFEE